MHPAPRVAFASAMPPGPGVIALEHPSLKEIEMTQLSRLLRRVVALVAVAPGAHAEIKTEPIEYKQGDTTLQGSLAYDDTAEAKRPGVLVVHEWWGHNRHARQQAQRLAEAGYVGFALDMYGKGKVTTHPKEAGEFAGTIAKDPETARARFMAALDLLRKHERVDAEHTAAIGYCFGGRVVLEMARAGVDLDAVASFHGSLAPLDPEAQRNIKARVLVLHGAADTLIKPEQIVAFKKEMELAGAKWKFVSYEGAKHSFTNPDADKTGMEMLGYHPEAAKESWAELLAMLKEVFAR